MEITDNTFLEFCKSLSWELSFSLSIGAAGSTTDEDVLGNICLVETVDVLAELLVFHFDLDKRPSTRASVWLDILICPSKNISSDQEDDTYNHVIINY